MDKCSICGNPCRCGICKSCLDDLINVNTELANRFIHALASRQARYKKKKHIKDEEETSWCNTIEMPTGT